MRIILSGIMLVVLSACAHEPMTPEQAYQMQRAGAALQGLGNQLYQMNRPAQRCVIKPWLDGYRNRMRMTPKQHV